MRFAQCIAALAAAASLTSAAALDYDLEQVEKRDGFSQTIEQIEGDLDYVSAAILLERYYHKYNMTPPSEVTSTAAKHKSFATVQTVPLKNQKTYITPVSIGGKMFRLILDTGSSDLWVFSSQQPKSQTAGHSVYSPGTSKTAKPVQGASWKVHYGDGSSSSGNVFRDVVKIGSVTSPHQYVEAAKEASPTFVQEKPVDGILGAAFDKLNTIKPKSKAKKPTFISQVQSQLKAPVIGAYLSANNKPGAYDIGHLNKKHYKGKIHRAKVSTAQGFWTFSTSSYSVGSEKFKNQFNLIADTGTSVTLLPRQIALSYYRRVKGALQDSAGGYYVPCNAKLPSFSIDVNGAKRTTPGKNLNYAPFQTVKGTKYCVGGIQSSTGGINILGDTFLQSQYVVFNYGRKTIGFADKRI